MEVIRSGLYFGQGYTNNEAEATAMAQSLTCLDELRQRRSELCLPVRLWGDSQLIIRHLTGVYKKPSKVRIYEAVETAKKMRRRWKELAVRHLPRDLNKVADDMARRA